MSKRRIFAGAALLALLASDAASALCARRSLVASALEQLYKRSSGGDGGIPFIRIMGVVFSAPEIAMVLSPSIISLVLIWLFHEEISAFLKKILSFFKHHPDPSDSLPTISLSSQELFRTQDEDDDRDDHIFEPSGDRGKKD